MFRNKLVLGLIIIYACNINNSNAMFQSFNKMFQDFSNIVHAAVNSNDNSQNNNNQNSQQQQQYINSIKTLFDKYKGSQIITKEIHDELSTLKNIPASLCPKIVGFNKNLYDNAYEFVLIRLLLNIINNNSSYKNIKPKCICEVKLSNKLINILYSNTKFQFNNTHLHTNKYGFLFMENFHGLCTYTPLTESTTIHNLKTEQLNEVLQHLTNISQNIYDDNIEQFQMLLTNQTFKNIHNSILNTSGAIKALIKAIRDSKEISIDMKSSIFNLLVNFYYYQIMHSKLYPIKIIDSIDKYEFADLYESYVEVYDMICNTMKKLKINNDRTFINKINEWNNLYNAGDNQDEFDGFEIIKASKQYK